MTTTNIQSRYASTPAFNVPTVSNEIIPSSTTAPITCDFSQDALLRTGAQDEFDIDEYIAEQDPPIQAAIDAQGAWVANALYPGALTLATLRLKAGLSQRAFASRCGLLQPNVSRYESGNSEPGIFLASTMANVLGVPLEQLVVALRNTNTK
jgi:DNA-binding XRE family transcriptional regulator